MLRKQPEDSIRRTAKSTYTYSDDIVQLKASYSDVTLTNYKLNMTGIINAFNKYYSKEKVIFEYPATLIQSPSKVITMLQKVYAPRTIVNKLSTIIWHLRTSYHNKEYKVDPFDIYIYIYLLQTAALEREAYEDDIAGKLTDKEQKNFIHWETILKARADMEAALDTDSLTDFTDFVIVCLYTYNPPTRADYANMQVFIFDEDVPTDLKENHCIICGPTPRFVFWKYKTATGKEPVVNTIPPPLLEILLKWMDINPTRYLLVSKIGGELEPMKENTLSGRIRSIFKRWTGKAASINTLRHAFISYNSRTDQIIKEKEANAKKMMHSTTMADKYRRYVYEKN